MTYKFQNPESLSELSTDFKRIWQYSQNLRELQRLNLLLIKKYDTKNDEEEEEDGK